MKRTAGVLSVASLVVLAGQAAGQTCVFPPIGPDVIVGVLHDISNSSSDTVAGVSYILAFNSAPVYLTGTAAIVIISMVMRHVPVGIRAGIAGLGQIDKSLDEASLSLRAGSLRTITHILLPLLRRS